MLRGDQSQAGLYSDAEKRAFEEYLAGQLAKIEIANPDLDYLREKILVMYANPLINQLNSI
jgi:hypothetical protein